jgi:hypothetical protein
MPEIESGWARPDVEGDNGGREKMAEDFIFEEF